MLLRNPERHAERYIKHRINIPTTVIVSRLLRPVRRPLRTRMYSIIAFLYESTPTGHNYREFDEHNMMLLLR